MIRSQLRQWLTARIAEVCGIAVSEVDADRPLREYGLTSRDAVELTGDLEDELDRELPTELLWQHPTISALATALTGDKEEGTSISSSAAGAPAPAASAASFAEPIAVIGVGCRLPGGIRGPDDFWRLLIAAENAISRLPDNRWEQFGHDSPEQAEALGRTTRWGGFLDSISEFDAEFFGITPREASAMDPQQRLLLEVAWEALEHAGLAADRLRGSSTGVFVGISGNEYGQLTLGDVSKIDAWSGTGSALSIAANRLSYVLDLRGPSVAVDSACSSSLVAVHLAMQSLRAGESEVALAAGANLLLSPGVTVNFDQMGITSPDGLCKPFDASADGIARAEGAGVVVLKPLGKALADGDRVLAVLKGSAVNSDGRSNGLTAPNPIAQQALLRSACAAAGIAPSDVDYVEAHGTGTLLGDPIEASALGAVLGHGRPAERPLLLGSVKSNLGHLEAAAGITGLIKVVLALANRRIPASLHFTEPNPHIPFEDLGLSVVAEQQPWPGGGHTARAGISGFGFGGTNAHVIAEQAPLVRLDEPVDGHPRKYLLAGGSADRLRRSAVRLADWLDGPGDRLPLSDVEHSLARRASGRFRAVVTATDRAELVTGLRALVAGTVSPGVATGRRDQAGPVWVFSGQGSQWAGMGRSLLRTEPAFAAAVDEVDAALRAEGRPLREVLESGIEPIGFADLQPVLFGVQVALAALWRHYGAEPAAVIGHSLGEVAAAVVAGAVSLSDGARIAVRRSRLLATTAGNGAMALLELSAAEVGELLRYYPGVDLAVYNAPGQTVVSGDSAQIEALVGMVGRRGLLAKLVNVDVASHSHLIAPVIGLLGKELAEVVAHEPRVPIYPTAVESGEVRFDAEYWMANARRPVRFTQAVEKALTDGYSTFVEISPHPVLHHAITETAEDRSVTVLGTLRRGEDESRQFHVNLGASLAAGDAAGWTSGRLLDLPSTPWLHREHWAPKIVRSAAGGAHPLLGVHLELPDADTHLWQADLGTEHRPWLADHRIDGRPVLAGACYVEMAFTAAATALGRPPELLELRGLSLHQPLPLTAHTRVTTTFTAADGRIRVHTRGDDGWVLHCSLTVAERGESESAWRPVNEPENPLAAADLYQRLRSLGVDYGPAFAGVLDARAGDWSAVATVEVPEGARPAGYFVHPVLLDSCLQTFAAALSTADSEDAYLPMEFGTVRVFGDPRVGVTSHVSVTPPEPAAGGVLGELRLLDADGRVLLEITDVFVRRVRRSELAAPLREKLLDREWQVSDAPEPQAVGLMTLVAAPGHPLAVRAGAALDKAGVAIRAVSEVDATSVSGVDGVVFFVDDQHAERPESGLRAVGDTVELVRAITDAGGQPPRVWLVTSSAAQVLSGETGRPGPAALRGLVRVLSFEHPASRVSWLDLDAADPAADLVTEVLGQSTEDEVAWRGGHRYVARLVPGVAPGSADTPVVRPDGGYVVTGGLGGLGLSLASWLAGLGAAKIVLNGRSAPNAAAMAVIDELTATGTLIEVVLGDIAEPGTAERLLAAAGTGAAARGVVHAAAVFDDRTVSLLDAETLRRSWLPKAYGAWRLHEATVDLELDWWLGFSSATALHGLPGQPAYASANAYLDAVVALRRASGLPAATINWGTWAEVGAAAGLEVPWMTPISPAEGLGLIGEVLGSGGGAVSPGAVRLNTARLAAAFPDLTTVPFFEALLAEHAEAPGPATDWPGLAALRDRDPADIRELAAAQLRGRIASVMGLAAAELADDVPLTGLGVDSLLAVRIRNGLQHDFEAVPAVSLLLRGASLADLRDWLFGELDVVATANLPRPRRPGVVRVPPRDAAERLVAAAWEEVLGVPVGVTQEFAAYGGNKGKADHVTRLLSTRTATALDRATLFERPTVELMAGLVRELVAVRGPVRSLRESGDGTPLFFFHPGGGDTAVFRQLVDLLPEDIPAYGFDRVNGTGTVEQRVQRYLPELRRIQPSGPYRLAGWSFGGFLAFEVARQLDLAGERVELLGLVDPILPLPLPQETGLSEVDLLEHRFQRFGEFLETSYGRSVELPYAELARLDDEGQADLLVATILAAGLVDERVSGAILEHQRSSFLDARLLERYRPQEYSGPAVFYSAAQQVPGGLRDPRFDRTDPARGWDAVCRDLEVVTVSGHHLSVLDPPNVEVIASHLAESLARVRY
ncbi:polyketide synthase [Amycolatopsis sp. H20-H5]|uniref:polyketide synthase n=1 Tax=Amycolatopsis sp. H20-H5 TaxID=3046309 RepID=UPI002DBAEB76|nr:polyketide synthase [Amycolatopsis sp. H20-H5]MEC3976430.1 beta-ketoacyl synthase N-terminal-like domain-containing protein [Amycolatopsis sp. H20-H5]